MGSAYGTFAGKGSVRAVRPAHGTMPKAEAMDASCGNGHGAAAWAAHRCYAAIGQSALVSAETGKVVR